MSSTKPSPLPAPDAARERGPERRRRLVALGLIAALPALVAGLVVGARHEDSARGAVERFLARLGERATTARCTPQLGPSAARRASRKRLRAHATAQAAETMTLQAVTTGRPAQDRRRPGRRAGGAADADLRHGPRRRCGWPSSSPPTARPASTGAPTTWCPGCAAASASRARRGCRRARRSRRATAPCSRRATRASASADPSASQVVGHVGPAPAGARRRARRAGRARRARPSASTGLERQFDDELRGTPGGTLLRGPARARPSVPQRGSTVRTTIDPKRPDGRGRGARRALRRDRRRAPAHRRGAGARRDRLLGAPAAGLDVQDRHARRRAASPAWSSARRDFPVADRGDARGRRAPERQRRVVRRHARGVVRRVLQLGLRAARRQAGRAPARRHRGALRLQRGRRRWPAPRARRSRPRGEIGDDLAVGSTRDRPGQGAGHAAADGDDRGRRSASAACAPLPDARRRGAGRRVRGHDAGRGADDRAATCARWCADGTGVGRRDPGRRGRGQDRHRRAAHDRQGGAAAAPAGRDAELPAPENDTTDTDAWFAAFAPAGRPRVAVAVLLVGQGAGGDDGRAGRQGRAPGRAERARRRGRRVDR